MHKSGEIVAQTGSEFVDGVSKGIEKTFQNKVEISKELKEAGLQTGKIVINSTDSTSDNILTVYVIFEKDLDNDITVKIYNENNQEYGRAKKNIKGQKNKSGYYDFIFDKRTNLNGKDKLVFE